MPESPETAAVSHALQSPSISRDVTIAPPPAEAAGADAEEGEQVVVTVRVRAPHQSAPTSAPLVGGPARKGSRPARRGARRRWSRGKLLALLAPAVDLVVALARRVLMRWP
jgi:hypothetical protein